MFQHFKGMLLGFCYHSADTNYNYTHGCYCNGCFYPLLTMCGSIPGSTTALATILAITATTSTTAAAACTATTAATVTTTTSTATIPTAMAAATAPPLRQPVLWWSKRLHGERSTVRDDIWHIGSSTFDLATVL